jgi:DNA invertase Pin-like site-specific DNA recombinase
MTKRAAVYIRMSDDSQENSPDRQKSQILPYCDRKGYSVVEIYEDHGMRGWDSSRPDFRRLLIDAQAGNFDVIVFDEQSRLCRLDPIDFFSRVAGPLKDAGVILEAVDKGPFNWDDIAGLLMRVFSSGRLGSTVPQTSR